MPHDLGWCTTVAQSRAARFTGVTSCCITLKMWRHFFKLFYSHLIQLLFHPGRNRRLFWFHCSAKSEMFSRSIVSGPQRLEYKIFEKKKNDINFSWGLVSRASVFIKKTVRNYKTVFLYEYTKFIRKKLFNIQHDFQTFFYFGMFSNSKHIWFWRLYKSWTCLLYVCPTLFFVFFF